jgi:p-cymene methyl-monooxygenase electron transfer component
MGIRATRRSNSLRHPVFSRLFGDAPERTVTLVPSIKSFAMRSGGVLLEQALAAGIPMPHNCKVGTCGSCKCRLVEGRISELIDFALSPLTGEELRAGYILACQSAVRSDLVVEVELAADAHFEVHSGKITRQERMTHDVMAVEIALESPITYTSGQYAHLGIAGIDVARSFSFARRGDANGNDFVEFLIRRAPGGEFTEALFAKDFTSTRATVEGPLGRFALAGGQRPMLCIAGGTGISPILSILEETLHRGEQREVVLVPAVRTQADLLAMDRIAALAENWPAKWQTIPILSLEPDGSDWTGERGHAAEGVSRLTFNDQSDVYLCGPPVMVDSCVTVLAARGVGASSIYADRFLDTSNGAQAQMRDLATPQP